LLSLIRACGVATIVKIRKYGPVGKSCSLSFEKRGRCYIVQNAIFEAGLHFIDLCFIKTVGNSHGKKKIKKKKNWSILKILKWTSHFWSHNVAAAKVFGKRKLEKKNCISNNLLWFTCTTFLDIFNAL